MGAIAGVSLLLLLQILKTIYFLSYFIEVNWRKLYSFRLQLNDLTDIYGYFVK